MNEEIIPEKQPRWQSWAVWLSFFGALWTIMSAFGLPEKWGIEEGTFKTVLDAVGTILIGFGILNNPTDREHF
jgi:hypothetical protein